MSRFDPIRLCRELAASNYRIPIPVNNIGYDQCSEHGDFMEIPPGTNSIPVGMLINFLIQKIELVSGDKRYLGLVFKNEKLQKLNELKDKKIEMLKYFIPEKGNTYQLIKLEEVKHIDEQLSELEGE